jgi:hypothetical protein
MRILRLALLLLTTLPATLAGFFGDDDSSSSSGGTASPFSTTPTNGSLPGSINTPEVAFLLTLQTAQISSMSCLITLFNMTTQPVGTCLGLVDLAGLIVGTDLDGMPVDQRSGAFSDQLTLYLGTTYPTHPSNSSRIAGDRKSILSGFFEQSWPATRRAI